MTNDHILSLRLPSATREAVNTLARAAGVSASEVIRSAIEQKIAAAGKGASP